MSPAPSAHVPRDELIRLATIMESLVAEVKNLSEKVELLKDTRVVELEKAILQHTHRTIVLESRLKRLEQHSRWLLRTVLAECLALLGGILLWTVQSVL